MSEELREAKEALARSNQKTSEILSSITDDFYVLDRNWVFVYANKQFTGRIGKEPEDFVGNCIWEMFPKHIGSILYENFHASMEKGEIRRFEVGGQYTDAWYRMTSFPSKEGITVLGSDITERKRAEEALRESEARLRNIGRAGRIGFFEWNASQDTIFWSPEHYELFGFEPGSPVSFERWLQGVHSEDREQVVKNSAQLLERARQEGLVRGHKDMYRYIRPDGSLIWLEADVSVEMIGSAAIVRGAVWDITERIRAEEAIRESENRFRVMADGTPAIIWVTHVDGSMGFINQAYTKFFGVTLEQIQSTGWTPLVHPEDVPGYVDVFIQCTREQKPFRAQARVRRCDGEWRWIDSHGQPRFSATGEFLGMVGSSLDITERKQSREALEKAYHDLANERNRMLAVMEALPVGVSILDRLGGVIQTNREFEAIWGGQPPVTQSVDDYAAYQAWWADTGVPLKPEEWAAAQAVQTGETVTGQFLQIQSFDGKRAFVLNSAAAILEANGEILGSTVAIMDITQQIEAQNALRESQDRFRVAVSIAPILVYTCDREQRYTWVYNPLRGFRAEDVLGKRDDEMLPPEVATELIAAKQLALETGQGRTQEVKVPLNGEVTYYILTTDPIRDPQGNVTGLTCSAIDITEQKCLEREQQEQAIQIEVQRRLMAQREQDRHSIARDLHDGPIQTLSSIMFHLFMIKEAFPDPKLQEELGLMGTDIKNTIHQLRDTLNDLRPPALMHFGFSKVAKMYIEDFRSQYPEIKINIDIEADDKRLSNDTHLTLYRIFQAGMNNIIRHAEATKVWVTLKIEPENFILTLRDNGKGFEVKNDFSLLTRSGHFGLVGMKERAEVIGAKLILSSEPGKGTTIIVKGPLNGKNLK